MRTTHLTDLLTVTDVKTSCIKLRRGARNYEAHNQKDPIKFHNRINADYTKQDGGEKKKISCPGI